jgi:hypothetical protein
MKEFIFVKSCDDLRSIAESALNWFLEIEYEEVHDILEEFEDDENLEEQEEEEDDQLLEGFEEDMGVACSYEDYEVLEQEKERSRYLEQIKKNEKYYKALTRETELNCFTPESLEKRIFNEKDVLMIQWLVFLLRDSKDMVEMNLEFGRSTMKMSNISLCFGKSFFQAFDFYEYHIRKPGHKFISVYYKAVLKENRLLYFYGFKGTILD